MRLPCALSYLKRRNFLIIRPATSQISTFAIHMLLIMLTAVLTADCLAVALLDANRGWLASERGLENENWRQPGAAKNRLRFGLGVSRARRRDSRQGTLTFTTTERWRQCWRSASRPG